MFVSKTVLIWSRLALTSFNDLTLSPIYLSFFIAVFDTATSYYYLCEFDQAETHWLDCLRILRKHEIDENSFASRRGIVLYCIVLSQLAQKTTYESSMFTMLNEAQMLLSKTHDKTILAYMEFLTGEYTTLFILPC